MAQIFLFFFISLSIVTEMLLEPNALFKSKVFLLISSAVVGDKKNVFLSTKT